MHNYSLKFSTFQPLSDEKHCENDENFRPGNSYQTCVLAVD